MNGCADYRRSEGSGVSSLPPGSGVASLVLSMGVQSSHTLLISIYNLREEDNNVGIDGEVWHCVNLDLQTQCEPHINDVMYDSIYIPREREDLIMWFHIVNREHVSGESFGSGYRTPADSKLSEIPLCRIMLRLMTKEFLWTGGT